MKGSTYTLVITKGQMRTKADKFLSKDVLVRFKEMSVAEDLDLQKKYSFQFRLEDAHKREVFPSDFRARKWNSVCALPTTESTEKDKGAGKDKGAEKDEGA